MQFVEVKTLKVIEVQSWKQHLLTLIVNDADLPSVPHKVSSEGNVKRSQEPKPLEDSEIACLLSKQMETLNSTWMSQEVSKWFVNGL